MDRIATCSIIRGNGGVEAYVNGVVSEELKRQNAIRAAEEELGENGRVLIRPSGTEPLIRVMVEAGTQQQAQAVTDRLVQHVENLQKTTGK